MHPRSIGYARASTRPRPVQASVQWGNIPIALIARSQWVPWHYGNTPSEKIPINVTASQKAGAIVKASITDPVTWSTFHDARTYYLAHRNAVDGIGYVFSPDDPYTGIDFDKCIGDPLTWPRVQAWLAQVGGYAERSPSGTGIKAIVHATVGRGRKKKIAGLAVEVYDRARYFTLTGDILKGHTSEVADGQPLVDELLRLMGGASPGNPGNPDCSHTPIISLLAEGALRPGGPLRLLDGSLRRYRKDTQHWLSMYLRTGKMDAYELEAQRRGWGTTESEFRYHAYGSLAYFGYPDSEIHSIARVLFPQAQPKRNTDRWWEDETQRCLYGPVGVRTLHPELPQRPTQLRCPTQPGGDNTAPRPTPRPRGRPRTLTVDELLAWYIDEGAADGRDSTRVKDAARLGISPSTLDRLDLELRRRAEQGQPGIIVRTREGRQGRRIEAANLAKGVIKNQARAAESVIKSTTDGPPEVLSDVTGEVAISPVMVLQTVDAVSQCEVLESHSSPPGVAQGTPEREAMTLLSHSDAEPAIPDDPDEPEAVLIGNASVDAAEDAANNIPPVTDVVPVVAVPVSLDTTRPPSAAEIIVTLGEDLAEAQRLSDQLAALRARYVAEGQLPAQPAQQPAARATPPDDTTSAPFACPGPTQRVWGHDDGDEDPVVVMAARLRRQRDEQQVIKALDIEDDGFSVGHAPIAPQPVPVNNALVAGIQHYRAPPDRANRSPRRV